MVFSRVGLQVWSCTAGCRRLLGAEVRGNGASSEADSSRPFLGTPFHVIQPYPPPLVFCFPPRFGDSILFVWTHRCSELYSSAHTPQLTTCSSRPSRPSSVYHVTLHAERVRFKSWSLSNQPGGVYRFCGGVIEMVVLGKRAVLH